MLKTEWKPIYKAKKINIYKNEFIQGYYIGRNLLCVNGHIEAINTNTMCLATGRSENDNLEFEFDVVNIDYLDEEDNLYVIFYDVEEMVWCLRSLYTSDYIGLAEVPMSKYARIGNLMEDEYWRKEWEKYHE